MNKKIKVLNVIPSLLDGGIESLVYKIYAGLDKNKYDLHIYCLGNIDKSYSYERFKSLNCTIGLFNFENTNTTFADHIKNIFRLVKLSFLIAKNRFDIVHSQDFFSSTVTRVAVLMALVGFYKPKRNYVTIHNMQHWLGGVARKINKFLSFFTDKIICVSSSVRDFIIEKDKIKPSKTLVVYNGIDTDEFKPIHAIYETREKSFGISPGEIAIGQVGTFSIRKGHKYLLLAFSKLVKKFPELRLLFVGGYRKHEVDVSDEIHHIIDSNNLGGNVSLLETRDDVYTFYNSVDIYVMPSIVEGFGLALAEAMACEKVVVCSDIPPFREIIRDKENGFLFRSKDVESLTGVLDHVISNYKEMDNIRQNARNTIEEKFSYRKMIENYEDLYNIN